MPIFEKRVLLSSIKGHLGVIFQTQSNISSKKSLFRGKFGAKIVRAKFAFGGVFPEEENRD